MPVITDGTLGNLSPKAATYQHPVFVTYLPIWTKLAHVREGAGGFLDGSYLVAHPREWQDYQVETPSKPTKKLKARRTLATYENIAARIVDAKKSALFREQPTRRVGDVARKDPAPLQQWWRNVDGRQTNIDAFLWLAWDAAATFGHVYIYMDRAADEGATTAADLSAPFLRLYTPLDVPDWVEDDRGELTAVKLLEAVPRESIANPMQTLDQRYRLVDQDKWVLYDKKGKTQATGAHGMGTIPVVRLYAQRRPLTPGIGQTVLDNPQHFIDLYNLRSELRELLRNQTFSILNVPLGTGPDAMNVEAARALMGQTSGTEDVLFSGGSAAFISADAANVTAYQTEIERVQRLIYRLAAIQWEADTKGVEAKGSLSLKREDMNQALSAYAAELEKADTTIAQLWYRAMHGETWEQKYTDDQVAVIYPSSFDPTPFEDLIMQAQAAISLGMPGLFLKELRKRLTPKFLPDLAPQQVEELNAAIDNAPDDPTPAERMQQKMKLLDMAARGGGKPAFGNDNAGNTGAAA
jgi:hypothetical protein